MKNQLNELHETAGSSVAVSSSQELNEQITSNANTLTEGASLTIQIENDLSLQADIAPIDTAGTVTIVAATGTVTVDGANQYRGFVVLSGIVTLSNITISNMVSQGAAGGMGAGAGLFVANLPAGNPYNPKGQTPNVTLSDVSFSNCSAQGGSVTSCASGGPGGAPGGYGGGGGDGPGTGGAHGTTGNPGMSPTGNSLFGPTANADYFGVVGPGGQGGSYGGGGSGGGDSGGFWAHDGDPGLHGNPGFQGGHGGYGGGAGAGGGGGGAGGGGGGGDGDINTGSGASGGLGGPGGGAGSPGFGGGEGTGATQGESGAGSNGMTGGQGGQGGSGSYAGGGAGFGGAVFVMSGASLSVEGAGSIAGGQAIGGTSPGASSNGAGAGSGFFLQGSGTLTFSPTENNTYTVNDEITDEAGAVAGGTQPRTGLPNGPDGLPTGGGQGTWGLTMTGDGTLTLQGPQAFSGPISVDCGVLDLSGYTNAATNDLTLVPGATLMQRPTTSSPLRLNNLEIISSPNSPTALALNGYSSIIAETTTIPNGITITVNPTGFVAGRPVPLIKSKMSMSPQPTVTLLPESGFTVKVSANAITVTMPEPS